MEQIAILRWLLAIAVLYVAGLPLAALVWPRLPQRGAAFALPLSIAAVGVTAVWVGQLRYGPGVALGVVLLPVVAGGVAVRRGVSLDSRQAVEPFAVFLVGFAVMLGLRSLSPTITAAGGEQFLHFGLLNAVKRASALPPEDMWFAGEAVRYYYGGHVTTATVASVAGVGMRYAYNLALATYFGVLVVGAYGLAGAVSAERDISRPLGGVCGAFFVAFAGALTTPVRLAYGHLPTETAIEYGKPVFGAIRHEYPEIVRLQSDPATWSWWHTRYVVPGTLQEVPLYSYVKGDHHGHTITTGFVLFGAALAYAYYRAPAEARRRRWALLFGALPALGGFLGLTNTWALPSVPGVAWLALLTADAAPATLLPLRLRGKVPRLDPAMDGSAEYPRLLAELRRVALSTILAVGVGALSILWAAPFLFGGTPTNEGIGFLPPRSNLIGLLMLYGGPFLLFAIYLGTRRAAVRPLLDEPSTRVQVGGALATLGLAALLLGPADFPALAVCGGLLAAGYAVVRLDDEAGYEVTLLLAGVGLVLSMELVHARVWPPELERWNTTLKVAIQAWTLSAVAAGIVAAALVERGVEGVRGARPEFTVGTSGSRVRAAGLVAVVAAVLLASAVFPAMVAVVELDNAPEEPTIDGFSGHERWHPDQLAAIQWLDEREGSPTIVEAPTRDAYGWGSPASTLTGLPTVAGWSHQQGYRGVEAFERRASHADRVYTGERAVVVALLEKYDVEYVWVGPIERERYGDVTAFGEIEGVDVAYENEDVTIYEVDQGRLPDSAYTFGNDSADGPGLQIAEWSTAEGDDGDLVVELAVENRASEERTGIAVAEAAAGNESDSASAAVTVEGDDRVTVRLALDVSYEAFSSSGELSLDLLT